MALSASAASLVAGAREREQAGGGEPGLLDRDGGVLLEQALQPACGDALVSTRVLPGDQDRDLERVALGKVEL